MAMGEMGNGQMAKRRGRPKTVRDDVTVKLDRTVAGRAKIVAQSLNISLAEYLTGLVRVRVDRDFAKVVKRLGIGEPEGPVK